MGNETEAARESLSLVEQYAWSTRTTASRHSQWRTWMQYCSDSNLAPLPVTEAHLCGFFGWLKAERERDGRRVRATSIPQYLTAVRQMHQFVTATSLPRYPFVDIMMRAYSKWEEEYFPVDMVRVGIGADTMMLVFNLGMTTTDMHVLRDCAALVFCYQFNGRRESSVMSIPEENVVITAEAVHARVVIVKGRRASAEQLLGVKRPANVQSAADLIERWAKIRRPHARFFGKAGDPMEWVRQDLTDAMTRIFSHLQISPPPGGKHTSYSLRIGSHTEQVLLGIPLEARMARFGWKHSSDSMPALYFDRTIQLSSASFWFFGQHTTLPASETSAAFASLPPRPS